MPPPRATSTAGSVDCARSPPRLAKRGQSPRLRPLSYAGMRAGKHCHARALPCMLVRTQAGTEPQSSADRLMRLTAAEIDPAAAVNEPASVVEN
eukprot:5531294-Alexandrium_andersonii.AAC.1